MDHNNNTILRNDVNNIQNVFIDNEINNYSNAPTNVIQMRQPSSNVPCNNTNFPATPTMSYISNNHEQQATFEIPGFEIIIVPTSPPFVNLNNLDMENHLQQDLSNNGY
ncbi:9338_t:CDS:2 [Rhizophagus irregularis]|nr:9338_t:CDS:2 [Rhizophagus irregularis]